MSCEDQINTEDLINAKTDSITLGEVATSRAGAVEGGAPITTSTNRFGEATDTVQGRLNKLGVIYDDPIRDWSAGLLVSDLRAHRYPATTGDIYIPKKELPFTTGGSFNANDWVILQGTISDSLVVTVSEAKAIIYTEGTTVIISDRDSMRFKFTFDRNLLAGELATEMTFDDELHVLVDAGGMLVFDEFDKLTDLESQNYATYEGKIRDRTSSISIDAYGDSITYAQANPGDPGSTDRIGDPTNFGDGSAYAHWQFNDSYPSNLSTFLGRAVANTVSVSNRGFSGDRMYNGYLRHRVVTSSDVSLVMYGVNDALFSTNNGANPEGITTSSLYKCSNFAKLLHLFCAREILRGKCIMVMGVIPFGNATGYDGSGLSASKLSTAYSDAAKSVAGSLNLKYIDTRSDIFRQYSGIFNDGTHLNSDGFGILSSRISSPLTIGGYKGEDYNISSGDVVLINELHSRVQSKGVMEILNSGASSTPHLVNAKPSLIELPVDVSIRDVVIPFYAKTDNLVIYPTLRAGVSTTIDIFLDHGVLQPVNMASYPLGLEPDSRPLSVKSITINGFVNRSNSNFSNDSHPQIHVANRGWHTLTIKTTGATVATIDSLVIDDLKSVLANDVDGGVTSLAHFNGNPVSLGKTKNINSVVRDSLGTYTITFTDPLANSAYSIIINTFSGSNLNAYKVDNQSASSFTVTFTEGPGLGQGIDWVKYDPALITLRTIGGR